MFAIILLIGFFLWWSFFLACFRVGHGLFGFGVFYILFLLSSWENIFAYIRSWYHVFVCITCLLSVFLFWFIIIWSYVYFFLYHCWQCASPHIYNQDVTTPVRWHSKSQTRRQVLWLCIIIIQRRQWGSTNSLKARSIWLQCETVLSSVTIIRIWAIPLESCPPRPSFFLIWPC